MSDERHTGSPIVSIVDDDVGFCESLADLFESVGYRTYTFSAAVDFLGSDAVRVSDVLITDIQLGGMDGLTLMDRVAEVVRIPVIVMTARTEEEWRIQAVSKGCVAFLRKPFEPGVLLGQVAAVLG